MQRRSLLEFDMSFFDDERDPSARRDRALPTGHPLPANASESPYETLLGGVDQVIGEWRALVVREPWAKLPASRLVDAFPEILPKLLRLARSGVTHIDDPLRELIADAHGHFRRVDGIPLTSVTDEWAHLKRACRRVLDAHGTNNGEADRAMERLDILVDDAVGYTLRGYYRPELDSLRGRGLERREVPNRRRDVPDRRQRGQD
jgi:hypothetical protein